MLTKYINCEICCQLHLRCHYCYDSVFIYPILESHIFAKGGNYGTAYFHFELRKKQITFHSIREHSYAWLGYLVNHFRLLLALLKLRNIRFLFDALSSRPIFHIEEI